MLELPAVTFKALLNPMLVNYDRLGFVSHDVNGSLAYIVNAFMIFPILWFLMNVFANLFSIAVARVAQHEALEVLQWRVCEVNEVPLVVHDLRRPGELMVRIDACTLLHQLVFPYVPYH